MPAPSPADTQCRGRPGELTKIGGTARYSVIFTVITVAVISIKLPISRQTGTVDPASAGGRIQFISGARPRGDDDEHGGTAVNSRRYVLGGYAVWMTLLLAVYYWLPGVRVEAWGLIGL